LGRVVEKGIGREEAFLWGRVAGPAGGIGWGHDVDVVEIGGDLFASGRFESRGNAWGDDEEAVAADIVR